MRLVPNTDTVPASLNRYLLPKERQVISVRQHPAVLIGPVSLVIAGLIVAALLSNFVAQSNGTAILIIWLLWAVLLLWLVGKVADWSVQYFAVTSERLLATQGLVTRRVNMIPLNKVTDVEFRRTGIGRFLGYGEFEVLAPGMDGRMRHIKFLPYPEQLYLEVCGLLFKDDSSD
jgi:membrane protein YdbS with pleckstrin-like domain